MVYSTEILDAILRQDFNSFIVKVFNTINPAIEYRFNWHIALISDYLQSVQNGDINRLIINIPPRSLKSICVSVAWPAWLLGHDPTKRIMVASYSQILSIKHSLDCRLVISSNWYKQLFPSSVLSKTHNQKSKFLTMQNGFRFATSVGGSATGEGGDILIIDDLHNPVQINSNKMRTRAIEWFEQTFATRLNNREKGAIVVVMQRLHAEDLSGYLLKNSDAWQHLKIPCVADQDYCFNISINNQEKQYKYPAGQFLYNSDSASLLFSKLAQEIGNRNYAAQYLQEPFSQG